jgi:vacuolar protein sorting-associated protein 26
MSMGRELEPAGVLEADKQFKFSFNKFEKENESYNGIQVKLRLFNKLIEIDIY